METKRVELEGETTISEREFLASQVNIACARGEMTAKEAEQFWFDYDREEYLDGLPHTD